MTSHIRSYIYYLFYCFQYSKYVCYHWQNYTFRNACDTSIAKVLVLTIIHNMFFFCYHFFFYFSISCLFCVFLKKIVEALWSTVCHPFFVTVVFVECWQYFPKRINANIYRPCFCVLLFWYYRTITVLLHSILLSCV